VIAFNISGDPAAHDRPDQENDMLKLDVGTIDGCCASLLDCV